MKPARYLLASALAVAVTFGVLQIRGVQAQSAQEYVPKAKSVTLHHAALPGSEGKEAIIKHFLFPAGFVGERHYHPGPVFVYVVKGTLTIETDDGIETYKTGELYPEPLMKKMQGKNMSTSEDLELVVFQIGDVGKPMMIKSE